MGIDTSGKSLLALDDHVSAIEAAATALSTHARQTWLGATVPTCPDWSVLDLVTHAGMVHRWATAAIHADRAMMGNADSLETEGRTSAQPIAWFDEGVPPLLAALSQAPADLDTLVFLKEPPAPREFWARRQAHETTVHALDALAAVLGRPVAASDVWFGTDLAADGIDELVIGFWQRSRSAIRSPEPYAVWLRPDDAPVSWVVAVSDGPVRTRRVIDAPDDAPSEFPVREVTGSAVDLYLRLWNRGGTVSDPDDVLEHLTRAGAITWS